MASEEPAISAIILTFPKHGRLPRAAIEATIEQLIELLDGDDTPTMDCEPEVDEESDDTEAAALPERHGTSGTAPMLRLISGDRHSSDAL